MADDDFEFKDMEEVQKQMTARHAKNAESTDKDPTLDELDDEPVMIEGGDDDWKKPEEGADLEYTGDKKGEKEEVEEIKEEEVEEEKVEEEKPTAEEEADKKAMDDRVKYLDEDGGGTKYVVKGKEYDLRDLSPQEFKDRFSKAGRFYERMEELADKEKTLVERERLAEQGARQSQDIMQKYGGKADEVKIPKALQVNEDDSDTERGLKEVIAELSGTVNNLKQGYQQQTQSMTEQELYRQLDTLTGEFPMASKEEIIAVKYNYPDADMRSIAENSHNNRISDKYLDAVLQARPEKLREIEEKAIEKHLAKKQQAKKVSRKTSSSTVSSKSSTKKKVMPRTLDDIEAQLDKDRPFWDFEPED